MKKLLLLLLLPFIFCAWSAENRGAKIQVNRNTISYVGYATDITASGVSVTIATPTNTVDGDFMVALLTIENTANLVNLVPSGWTLGYTVNNTAVALRVYTYWKIASASEAATHQWGISAARDFIGTIMTFRNVAYLGTYAESTNYGATTFPLINPLFISSKDNILVYHGACNDGRSAWSAPPATPTFTEVGELRALNDASSISMAFGYSSLAAIGNNWITTKAIQNNPNDYSKGSMVELVP